MKTTEIINLTTISTQIPTFQDDRLNKSTQRIFSIYNDAAKYADTKNREIAKILADISAKKSYEKDGFKSVGDYATKVFGIGSQNAYALATAGKVYSDDKAHPELKAMSPSKIAEISKVDSKDLQAALESGEITHETTQKDLRNFATSHAKSKKDDKPEVLNQYTARLCTTIIDEATADTLSCPKLMDDWDDFFMEYVSKNSPDSPIEIVKLPKGFANPEAKKATVERRLYFNRTFSAVVEFYTYVKPKPKKESTPKYTREQLMEMLAKMDEQEKVEN